MIENLSVADGKSITASQKMVDLSPLLSKSEKLQILKLRSEAWFETN